MNLNIFKRVRLTLDMATLKYTYIRMCPWLCARTTEPISSERPVKYVTAERKTVTLAISFGRVLEKLGTLGLIAFPELPPPPAPTRQTLPKCTAES
jgi:hypothetical protein